MIPRCHATLLWCKMGISRNKTDSYVSSMFFLIFFDKYMLAACDGEEHHSQVSGLPAILETLSAVK